MFNIAHQMASYVKTKAITFIDLFFGLSEYKSEKQAPGTLPNL